MANERPNPTQAQQPPRPEGLPAFAQAQHDYLLKNGWRPNGPNERGLTIWDDPAGTDAKPKAVLGCRLPVEDGKGEQEVKQMRGGPIPWSYPTERACEIQRQRDAAKAKVA